MTFGSTSINSTAPEDEDYELRSSTRLPLTWEFDLVGVRRDVESLACSEPANSPSLWAKKVASFVLDLSSVVPVRPRLSEIAEPGIGIAWSTPDKYADIEIFNDEEILFTVRTRGAKDQEVWETKATRRDIEKSIKKILTHYDRD